MPRAPTYSDVRKFIAEYIDINTLTPALSRFDLFEHVVDAWQASKDHFNAPVHLQVSAVIYNHLETRFPGERSWLTDIRERLQNTFGFEQLPSNMLTSATQADVETPELAAIIEAFYDGASDTHIMDIMIDFEAELKSPRFNMAHDGLPMQNLLEHYHLQQGLDAAHDFEIRKRNYDDSFTLSSIDFDYVHGLPVMVALLENIKVNRLSVADSFERLDAVVNKHLEMTGEYLNPAALDLVVDRLTGNVWEQLRAKSYSQDDVVRLCEALEQDLPLCYELRDQNRDLSDLPWIQTNLDSIISRANIRMPANDSSIFNFTENMYVRVHQVRENLAMQDVIRERSPEQAPEIEYSGLSL